MSNAEQNWQEYQDACSQLKFSLTTKHRLTQILLDPPQVLPRQAHHPIRVLAVSAVICAMLTTTAVAAVTILRNNSIRLVDSPQAAVKLAGEAQDETAIALDTYDGDWEYQPPTAEIAAWWEELAQRGAEETIGTTQDCWTTMRSLTEDGETKSCCLGNTVSDFDHLWAGVPLNFAQIESQYTPIPGAFICFTKGTNDFSLIGAYQSGGNTAFTIEYNQSDTLFDSSYSLSTSYAYSEQYVTSDGVEVLIYMDKSNSGKQLFWVDYEWGHDSFHMVGTEMELDEVKAILDSLRLART